MVGNSPLGSNTTKYFGFMLGNEEFNTPISLIQEIIEMPQITYVPNVAGYVEGVMNLRGRVVPVVDIKKRLGLGEKNISLNTRIIVFRVKSRTVGFIVDAITEVFELSDDQIELRTDGKFTLGVSKLENRLPVLLDIPKILDATKSQDTEKRRNVISSQISENLTKVPEKSNK